MDDVVLGKVEIIERCGMVGFRNVAVHDYRRLDLDVVEAIIERHLDDLLAFARIAVRTLAAE